MKKCWCGNSDLAEYSSGYYWCQKCNSLVTKSDIVAKTENLDDENDFYGKKYWYDLMTDRSKCTSCDDLIDLYLKERAAYWLKNIYRFLLPGDYSVLEIGCGLGQLSYLLKCSGYQETAYELSPSICRLIRDKLHINVINEAFKKNGKKYDAIIAMDLVEHLSDPAAFFSDISQSITDDGIAVIQTPCFNETVSFAELEKNNPKFLWLLTPNEHLFLFSRDAIIRLLEENGFVYYQFPKAYFGDDYDMFLIASKSPLKENTDEQIRNSLYTQPCGRLINALIMASEERRKAESEKNEACRVSAGLVRQLDILSVNYKSLEENRDGLLSQLRNLMQDYEILEKNRDGLLSQLSGIAQDYEILEKNRDGLLSQLNGLMQDYENLEKNRNDLLEQLRRIG